jgi:hypothetical protein
MPTKKATKARATTKSTSAKKPVKRAPKMPPTVEDDPPLKEFVLRTYSGTFIHSVSNLITANQLARGLGIKIKVFKRTPEGEVLMSFNGPKNWD